MDTLTKKSSEIEKHLTPKAEIIRCPECWSTDVVLGIVTTYGTPVFCLTCGTMTETRREG